VTEVLPILSSSAWVKRITSTLKIKNINRWCSKTANINVKNFQFKIVCNGDTTYIIHSCADSVWHGGHIPPPLTCTQMNGHGAPWVALQQTKNWPNCTDYRRKRSPQRLVVLGEPKSGTADHTTTKTAKIEKVLLHTCRSTLTLLRCAAKVTAPFWIFTVLVAWCKLCRRYRLF